MHSPRATAKTCVCLYACLSTWLTAAVIDRHRLALDPELLPSGGRDLVCTGTAIVLRGDHSRFDPARLLHAMQRRIQRPFLDAKDVRQLMDPRRNGVAVQRSPFREHIEDQQAANPGVYRDVSSYVVGHELLSELGIILSELSIVDYSMEVVVMRIEASVILISGLALPPVAAQGRSRRRRAMSISQPPMESC